MLTKQNKSKHLRRPDKPRTKHHICVPDVKQQGQVYLLCKLCGRAMKHKQPSRYDPRVEQLVKAVVPKLDSAIKKG